MKKKGFIGLSTLLLVLLLGLSTTSYASITSVDEFKNFIYNAYAQNYTTGEIDSSRAETVSNFISAHSTDIQQIYNDMMSYTGYVIPAVLGNTVNTNGFRVMLTNNKFYSAGTGNYVQGINRSYYLNISNNTISTSTAASFSGFSTNWNVYSASVPVYVDTSYTTIRHEAGDYPSNYLDGDYTAPSHAEIIFTPIPKVQDVYVGQNLDIYTYGVNQNNTYGSMKFGDLYVPSGYYITRVDSTYLYFERASETWKEKILLQEVGSDLTLSNYSYNITNFKWENYDSSTYTIDYSAWIRRDYLHANCMYTFTFSGYYLDESDPFYIEYIFYIIDGNTVLTGTLGDELDPSFLITGPYADDYAADIDDLNDKVDDNADLVDAIGQGLDGTLRPASGDWFPLNNLSSGDSLLGTAQLWGFRNYANGYWDSLYAVFSNTTYTLQQTGNVQLSVSFHGYTKVLNSNDFTTPSGDLKTFISSALVMGTMFAVYKLFSRKIEKIKRADLTDIKNEAKDDSDLM